MKTSRILKVLGIVLFGMVMTAQVNAIDFRNRSVDKKSVTLTVDKPIVEFISKIYEGQMNADDILRIQKMVSQIDHITVTFRDEDASDYVLKFKSLDEQGLEDWMFNEGYLNSAPEPEAESAGIEPWMLNQEYLEE